MLVNPDTRVQCSLVLLHALQMCTLCEAIKRILVDKGVPALHLVIHALCLQDTCRTTWPNTFTQHLCCCCWSASLGLPSPAVLLLLS